VLAQAEALGTAVLWVSPRPSKQVSTLSVRETWTWQGTAHTHRRVTRVIERTIDRRGQTLLEARDRGLLSLDLPDTTIIALYCAHPTSE
jgi:hypothetical protein